MWAISPRPSSTVVTALAVPPPAETCMIPVRLPKTMTSSWFQLPPVKPEMSPMNSTTPSTMSTRFSVRPSLNATNRPSGDQNSGEPMTSVGATGRVSPEANEWTRRRGAADSSPSM